VVGTNDFVDACIFMLDNRMVWAGPGVERPELFLAWKVGLSTARAKQIVTIAERAPQLPDTMEAFRRGELAIDQVAAIAARAPWWVDTQVCELARYATVHQLRRTLNTYPFPDIAHPDESVPEPVTEPSPEQPSDDVAVSIAASTPPAPPDRVWFGTGADGRFRMNLECDELTGMIITSSLREARDKLFDDGHPDVDWIDALRELAERSLDGVSDLARRDRYRLHIHLRSDGTSIDDRGRILPDAIRRHISCDALITPTFLDGTTPVSVGRSTRAIPERLRRLVILRDRGCTVRGCTQTHVLEVHHIIHWEDGGPTDTWNLICLCPHHHRLHHRGELGITGNADNGTVTFTNRHGDPLEPTGARPQPPGAPPPPPTGVYQHPLGERLDTQWLYFNPPPEHRPTVWPRTA
jgi:hypothetical protein